MTLDEAITELRKRNEPVRKPSRLPTETEIHEAETAIGVTFHPDYRLFLLTASDIEYSILQPATITHPGVWPDLVRITERARIRWKVPYELVPFCEDNSDYHCMTPNGRVLFWSHDLQGPNGEEWPDLAAWIEQVWMMDYNAG
jgi:hypothetical protein